MLSDAKVRSAKPAAKPYKLTDQGGLHLYVSPAGGKVWRWRFEMAGREKLLTLGRYPDVTLGDARRLRDAAEVERRSGSDPAQAKRHLKRAGARNQKNSFEAIAREWHSRKRPIWTERHGKDVLNSLFPIFEAIGATPIHDIEPPIVLEVLRKIEARPAIETARRVRQRMSEVFVYAIASGLAKTDPAAIVAGAMAPLKKGRRPAITDLAEARAMLAKVEAEPAHPLTKLLFRFLALTSVRPGEARLARRIEFEALNSKTPLWRIPAARMKMKREHLVPLSAEAVEVLKAVEALAIRGDLVFPSVRRWKIPMSENALGFLMRRAGFDGVHVPHGWRSTFSTIMNERYPNDRAAIDLMLAHAPANAVEGAYNRAEHIDRRRKLAQIWASLILKDAPPAAELLTTRRRRRSGDEEEAVA